MKQFLFIKLLTYILAVNNLSYANNCIHNYSKNEYIHISKIDLSCPKIKLITSLPKDNGITVSEFANKYHTSVAINGSFFRKDLSPIGLNISEYKLWNKAKDTRSRSFLACNNNRECIIEPKNKLTSINKSWYLAISGWQYYDNDSKKFECSSQDKIGCSQNIFKSRHPRTMLGLNKQKNLLYLVVVEGRQLAYLGMTMDELALLATELNLTQAINLDGGGSSTMVINNKRISNLPLFQNSERSVANHFGVILSK